MSASDATTGSALAVLHFLSNWVQRTEGVIRAGSRIRVEYDSQRLPAYRHWHTGVRFWWIRAYIRFHPAPEVHTKTLVAITPETAATPNPLMVCELWVPAGTNQLELWLENGDQMSPGTDWDSRYGANYLFDVVD